MDPQEVDHLSRVRVSPESGLFEHGHAVTQHLEATTA
jgi:hypothetical protein